MSHGHPRCSGGWEILFSLVGYIDALNRMRAVFIRKGERILDKQIASFGYSDVVFKIF